jgi:hypothetical protein
MSDMARILVISRAHAILRIIFSISTVRTNVVSSAVNAMHGGNEK